MNADAPRKRRRVDRRVAIALAVGAALALVLIVGGWNAREDSAAPAVVNPDVTPSGDAVVPDGLEAIHLTVKDGKFEERELILQGNQPTILSLVNQDGTPYRLQIDGLVDATAVAPVGETTIDFTEPDPGVYEGHLLPSSGGTSLATIRVEVQQPAGSI